MVGQDERLFCTKDKSSEIKQFVVSDALELCRVALSNYRCFETFAQNGFEMGQEKNIQSSFGEIIFKIRRFERLC